MAKCVECKNCEFHRNCINGLYCMKLKKYVEYSHSKQCESQTRK